MAFKTNSKKPTKIKFDDEDSTEIKGTIVAEEAPKKNKHIKFGNDDEDDVVADNTKNDSVEITRNGGGGGGGNDDGSGGKNKKQKNPSKKSEKNRKNAMDIGTHWYQVVSLLFCSFLI